MSRDFQEEEAVYIADLLQHITLNGPELDPPSMWSVTKSAVAGLRRSSACSSVSWLEAGAFTGFEIGCGMRTHSASSELSEQ